jgi:hypothetical protein
MNKTNLSLRKEDIILYECIVTRYQINFVQGLKTSRHIIGSLRVFLTCFEQSTKYI